jgi:hypothetical protein
VLVLMTLRFALPIKPVTKKTSNRIAGLGKPCHACGKRKIQRVMPSEQFEAFESAVLDEGAVIIPALRSKGASLPITGPVHVRALFYRDADRGDVCGFQQALGDVLQGERYTVACPNCQRGRKIGIEVVQTGRFDLECLGCGHGWTANATQAKLSRRGLGIIADDSQIVHWDGTRLMIDRERPRIEVEVIVIEQAQMGIFNS